MAAPSREISPFSRSAKEAPWHFVSTSIMQDTTGRQSHHTSRTCDGFINYMSKMEVVINVYNLFCNAQIKKNDAVMSLYDTLAFDISPISYFTNYT